MENSLELKQITNSILVLKEMYCNVYSGFVNIALYSLINTCVLVHDLKGVVCT